jgi:hypothetical protein
MTTEFAIAAQAATTSRETRFFGFPFAVTSGLFVSLRSRRRQNFSSFSAGRSSPEHGIIVTDCRPHSDRFIIRDVVRRGKQCSRFDVHEFLPKEHAKTYAAVQSPENGDERDYA